MEPSKIAALFVFLVLLPCWALYYTRSGIKSVEGYVFGGRALGPVASAFTAATAATSAGLFVGGAGMAYQYGWGGGTWQIGAAFGVFITWFIVAPKIREVSHKVKAITTPELFVKRYGSNHFYPIVAVWIVIFTVPMLVVQMRSAALTIESYLGLPYVWSLVLFSTVLVIFSSLGGRSAIAYLDTVQGMIMIICVTVAIIVGLKAVGGISGIDHLLVQQNPSMTSFFGEMPRSLWYNLAFVYLFGLFSSPHIIPAFYGMKDARTARLAFPIGVVISLYWTFAAVLIGLVPRALGIGIETPDKAFAAFITHVAPEIVGMLLVFCLLAAVFTTLDALLMAAGSSIVHDIIGRIKGQNFTESEELRYSKIATVVIGLLALILSGMQMPLITILNAFGFGAFVIVIGVPMILALFWDKANREAAYFCTTLGPIIYILWRTYLVKITGLGELPGTLLVVLTVSVICSLVKPANNELYFQEYRKTYFNKVGA
ncbi:sodium:solute symporter family protein [Desulfosporosinus sp.]|uniref:sodium:solute symporter family protein n=1 Tax=Desulfosporosinus sp. TaxID=157907 RepID=UPI0025C21942|nr:sodium:solute symporter family protein [Desulfosporosinus sp.]MBC2722993.1 sodium:solute symporter family protein [Desulfosporosinus sp.]MBC2729084.1 sodium:solute symporter family protein [Desulfosporosinus sp.]